MAMTNVELYEALKGPIGAEAAKLMAEVVPPAQNLATKDDLRSLEIRLLRWLVALFVPMYAGTFGVLVALVFKT